MLVSLASFFKDFKFVPLIGLWVPNILIKGHIPWFKDPNPRVQTLRVQRNSLSSRGYRNEFLSKPGPGPRVGVPSVGFIGGDMGLYKDIIGFRVHLWLDYSHTDARNLQHLLGRMFLPTAAPKL